jgi:hypothetical protein
MSEQDSLKQMQRVLEWYKLQQQIFGAKTKIEKSKKVKNEKLS